MTSWVGSPRVGIELDVNTHTQKETALVLQPQIIRSVELARVFSILLDGRCHVLNLNAPVEHVGERMICGCSTSQSRHRHRESDVWQRRFWEHTVESEEELEALMNYIHYNPVRHGLTSCPHLWPYSSFRRWVDAGLYPEDWGCCCDGRTPDLSADIGACELAGE